MRNGDKLYDYTIDALGNKTTGNRFAFEKPVGGMKFSTGWSMKSNFFLDF
jgi:hypothetical protein